MVSAHVNDVHDQTPTNARTLTIQMIIHPSNDIFTPPLGGGEDPQLGNDNPPSDIFTHPLGVVKTSQLRDNTPPRLCVIFLFCNVSNVNLHFAHVYTPQKCVHTLQFQIPRIIPTPTHP